MTTGSILNAMFDWADVQIYIYIYIYIYMNVGPKNMQFSRFGDFICQESTVFGQQGWNGRNVARLAVRCCSMDRIRRRLGILEVIFPNHRCAY